MSRSDEDPDAAERRRPTVYQVAARAGVSIATVSRALRDDASVSPATKQRVKDALAALTAQPPEPTTQRRRPTVYQVAERAGVSIATVSRALREDDVTVSPATRQRVKEAAKELNWWPSRAAQVLAGADHGVVAIVFPDLSGPYYANVIAGFESEVADQGGAVMVLGTHGRQNSQKLVRDLSTRVDGLVIMDQTIPDSTVAEVAANHPVVLLARPRLPGVATVRSENHASATAITHHLLEHDLRQLRFLGEPELTPDVADRWRGFTRAHEEKRLPAPSAPVRCGGFSPEHGYQAALTVLADDTVDAIVCANDELASGVYRAAAELGRSVPEDLAITGWDDVNLAVLLSPRLTTVRQPLRQLGGTAGQLLFTAIESGEAASQTLPSELVIRQSCGCHG